MHCIVDSNRIVKRVVKRTGEFSTGGEAMHSTKALTRGQRERKADKRLHSPFVLHAPSTRLYWWL